MPLRSFRSVSGVTWQVWSVIPGVSLGTERRTGYDRRSPDPVLRYTGPERRREDDRRRGPTFLSQSLQAGWLAFESPAERRRLAPIPPGWDRLCDAALERLCERAEPVPRVAPGPLAPS